MPAKRLDGKELGRDGCRVPLPWSKDEPAFGFNRTGDAWLPQPTVYGDLAVDQQEGVAGSTLELYRELLRIRKERDLGEGALSVLDEGADVLAARVETRAGTTQVLVNFGAEPVEIPSGATVLVASEPDVDTVLPTDTAVWFTV